MAQAGGIILRLLREAWLVMTMALLAFAMLAGMAQALRAASASLVGARFGVWQALSALGAILMLALFAFSGAPAIVRAAGRAIPSGAGCGPIAELGGWAASLIAALAAVRVLKAALVAAAAASLGGSISLSDTLLEAGEAILGMMIASAALPLAAALVGVC